IAALGGKLTRHALAQPGAGAGDEDVLSVCTHAVSSFSVWGRAAAAADSVPIAGGIGRHRPLCEESLDRRDGGPGIFLVGHMAELVEYDQAAAGDVAVEAPGVLDGDEPVLPTPDDQRRLRDLWDLLLEFPALVLHEACRKRIAVAGAQTQLVIALDQ